MAMSEFGDQQLTGEDRGYAGSRFKEVVDALFANLGPSVVRLRGRAAGRGGMSEAKP